MYMPSHFAVADPATLETFMRKHSFATLVTSDGGSPFASHLPLLFQGELGSSAVLTGHVARANPQWRHFAPEREVLAIFQGPHAYISPGWYRTQPSVPTWNYAVVHTYGRATIVDDEVKVASLLQATIETYESECPNSWQPGWPADYFERMQKGIVAFEIAVTRVEGKFKLSQNRSSEDVASVISALSRSDDPTEREVAGLMSQQRAPRPQ